MFTTGFCSMFPPTCRNFNHIIIMEVCCLDYADQIGLGYEYPSWEITYPFPKSLFEDLFLFQRWELVQRAVDVFFVPPHLEVGFSLNPHNIVLICPDMSWTGPKNNYFGTQTISEKNEGLEDDIFLVPVVRFGSDGFFFSIGRVICWVAARQLRWALILAVSLGCYLLGPPKLWHIVLIFRIWLNKMCCFPGGCFKYFLFSPLLWGWFPFWLIFFRWVETTNQFFFPYVQCVF